MLGKQRLGAAPYNRQSVFGGPSGFTPDLLACASSDAVNLHFPSWWSTLFQAGRDAIVGVREIRAGLRDHQAKLDLECGLHGDANRVVAASGFGLLACEPALWVS